MLIIGSHVNFGSNQLVGAVNQALSYGANTFMFYTGAPQNTIRKKLEPAYINEAKKLMQEGGINLENVICHAPYIVNLANKEKEDAWHFSINFLKQEIKRVEELGVKYLVLHPGNALKIEREVALNNISEALNAIINEDSKVMILLETMAGKGTECGKTTEEIKTIMDGVLLQDKVGVCLDTCHLNDAGYDINEFDEYLKEFASIIGIDKIKCVHINDSKNGLGSHKDRHANLGYGTIGFTNLVKVVYHELLKDVPKILETPWLGDYPPYKFEIAMLKDKTFNPNLEADVKEFYKNERNF